MNNLEILIDFDGTCVTHSFPSIGKDIGSVPVLKRLVEKGHKLILFTMRSDIENPKSEDKNIVCEPGKYLTEAVNWFKDNEIPLYGIQVNPTQHYWTTSPKAYGQMMIDDSALGVPLKFDERLSDRPFVCWDSVYKILNERGII